MVTAPKQAGFSRLRRSNEAFSDLRNQQKHLRSCCKLRNPEKLNRVPQLSAPAYSSATNQGFLRQESGPLGEPLQGGFRLLHEPGFWCSFRQGLQDLLGVQSGNL